MSKFSSRAIVNFVYNSDYDFFGIRSKSGKVPTGLSFTEKFLENNSLEVNKPVLVAIVQDTVDYINDEGKIFPNFKVTVLSNNEDKLTDKLLEDDCALPMVVEVQPFGKEARNSDGEIVALNATAAEEAQAPETTDASADAPAQQA